MKKSYKALCLSIALSLCIGMTSCAEQPIPPLSSQVLEELCSEPYAGRLAGTSGNAKAEQYLSSVMQEIGVAPFSDGYTMSYPQITADPNKQNTTVTIINADGSTRELKHGKDFYTNAAKKDLTLELPLAWGAAQWADDSIPVLLPGQIPPANDGTDVRIDVSDIPFLNVGTPETPVPFQIKISTKLAQQLQQDGASRVNISTIAVPEQSECNNIVGAIKSKSGSDRAVVLTAHFDHVGQQGSFVFNGVLDNASGTATLLAAAQRLAAATQETPLDFDIIIAAVNSEETRGGGAMPGSSSLEKVLSTHYRTISNINIDCVGLGMPYDLGSGDPRDEPSIQMFRDWLSDRSIAFSPQPYTGGDHNSFQAGGYPAFTIGGGVSGPKYKTQAHSNVYQTSDISITEMEMLAQVIEEFVIQRGENLLDAAVTAENQSEMLLKTETETDTNTELPFNSLAQVMQAYPDLLLPETLGEYIFSEAIIQTEAENKKPYHLLLTYNLPNLSRYIEIVCIKKLQNSPPVPPRESQTYLPMTELGFERYTLRSFDGGKSFYAVSFEENDFEIVILTVEIGDETVQRYDTVRFAATDAPAMIQDWGLEKH